MFAKQETTHFVLCPKQGNKIEVVVLNRVCIFALREIRVSKAQRLNFNEISVKYPPPPPKKKTMGRKGWKVGKKKEKRKKNSKQKRSCQKED